MIVKRSHLSVEWPAPGAREVVAVADADVRLILRCQSNDAAAFNEIVARYQNKVYNYICRMIGAGVDAEDLAQETFVRAYTNIHSFQSRASLNTWLFRIATNICIDHARRGKRRSMTTSLMAEDDETGESVECEFPDSRFDPQAVLMNAELGVELDRALAELPEKLRAVVVLHDMEGLPYDEIAGVVDCPLGTVKSRLFNARMALRQKLAPYLEGVLA